MKKLKTKGLIILGMMSLITSGTLVSNKPKIIKANTINYLITDKNYYEDGTISKGYLDKVISDGTDGNEKTTDTDLLNSLKEAANRGLIKYSEGMTYNQYFLANNISPEDNFSTANGMKVEIPGQVGQYNAHKRTMGVNPITYVGPATNRGLAYWGENVVSKPVLFSRLTVGRLPATNTEGQLSFFNRNEYTMPNRIGYGENGTVNDYMLTESNNFVIPTRFNTSRDDVYLTMRSHQFFGAGFDKPRVFFNATMDGVPVQSKTQNPNAYINLTGNVFITNVGYNQLGTFGRFNARQFSGYSRRLIHDIGINEFTEKMNLIISKIEDNRLVPIGTGGQIQLSGFYRQSAIDNDFTEMVSERENDAIKNINVKYYMYTDKTSGVTTPVALNGKHLYSPNETTYKLEVTRPYFTGFGTLSTPIVYDASTFEQDLGVNSFQVIDNGKQANGNDVGVDLSRVRARIDDGNGYSSTLYTLDELKTELNQSKYYDKTVQVAYTYAATDAQNEIIGKLPAEIENDKGAYAVPFVRSVKIVQPMGKLQIVKVDSEDTTIKLENVKFIVKDSTGTEVARLITNSEGIATSENLPLGEYTIVEKEAKEGYELLTEEVRATLKQKDEIVKVEITNKKKVIVKPQDPIKPKDPIKPQDPIKPKDPVKPQDPIKPKDPVKPQDPIKPKDPVKPQDPIKPQNLVKQNELMKPTEMTKKDVDTSDKTDIMFVSLMFFGSLFVLSKIFYLNRKD